MRLLVMLLPGSACLGQAQAPATAPGIGRFPHVEVNVPRRQVRVACETLHVEAPLEFFCVVAGGPEHESVLRTHARPSHIHTALLMIGLEPGEPVRYSEAAKRWFPPHGPALRISVEYTDEQGKVVTVPANKLMRDIRTRQPMPSTSWVFTGSRIMPDGVYAADVTGYVVSIVNFDLTPIDIPQLASNANETLEWQANLDALPPRGTPVTMILEPIDQDDAQLPPSPSKLGSATTPATRLSDVSIDQEQIDKLRAKWDREVRPHAGALRHAAQAQYEVLSALRREQQRLIDEADRIQRLIDELERQYQEMTTPTPPSTNQ
ncbi:YdjY domain-containing protein [Fontivita pretiosa]|uniref:YdjY domain-containing protein n=1 Tax=Fontivita pretiosa TaxID=2989684 RepID=UPI003D17CCBF